MFMPEIIPSTVNGAKDGLHGMLSHFHYTARSGGPNREVRRTCLRKVYETEFECSVSAPNYAYVQEFGPPSSEKRLMKIFHIIESNLNRFGSNTSNAWIECLAKWEEDISWFMGEFGPMHNVIFDED